MDNKWTWVGTLLMAFGAGMGIAGAALREIKAPPSITCDDLVSLGHAEYYLDENHARQWRLKECE